jgi:23S rRNA-/tRNA-specific pseudouridylate synthase
MAPRRGGKEATSHFTVDSRFRESTLLQVQIDTGRTHQIRVHMAMIGHPVIGDDVYGNSTSHRLTAAYGVERQFLHAASLAFMSPDGKSMKFEAPLPDDLVAILGRVREDQG